MKTYTKYLIGRFLWEHLKRRRAFSVMILVLETGCEGRDWIQLTHCKVQ
jgi:hypothetical protein